MTEPESLPRHEVALNFSRVMVVLITAGALIPPLLMDQEPLFTYLGFCNMSVALAIYLMVRSGRLGRYEPAAMIAAATLLLQPLLLFSGGINSQYAVLITVFPLAAALLGGNRLALITGAVWLAIIAALLIAAPHVPDVTGEPFDRDKTLARGVWTVLGLAVATSFGFHYQKLSRRMADELLHLATSDHLTGLANRRTLEAALDLELARLPRNGCWLSLLMIDVDHFKDFNDRHGHRAGDECLQDIARGLQRFTRQGQDLVVRYGGEEFVVMLTDTAPTAALEVAEKLRKAVAERTPVAGTDAVTVTIGVASANAATLVTREEFIHRADQALYAGKAAGRNRVVHVDAMADAA